MDFAKLRHRITIQTKNATADAYGEEVPDWTDYLETWAAVIPLSGREFMEGRREENAINYRIVIRYRDGLDPSMRVVFGDRAFDVEAVIERDSGRRELWLMCRELVD